MADVHLPLTLVREHLWAALDLVVHVARADGGERRVQGVYRCAPDGGIWLVADGVLQAPPSVDARADDA